MKKVLMVSCEGLGNGGVQNVMMNIIRSLKDEVKFDMLLFTSERRFYDDEFEQYGRIYRIPYYEGKNAMRKRVDFYFRGHRIYNETKKILLKHGPYDIIHCNNEFESALCIKAAKEVGVPIRISHSHIAPIEHGNFIRRAIEHRYRSNILDNVTLALGVSQKACEYLFGNYRKCIVLKNAVDLGIFNRRLYNTNKKSYSFAHIGSFNDNKNQAFVIRVFKEILKFHNEATLSLVGVGTGSESYLKYCRKLVDDFGINDRVVFLPHNENIPALLAQTEYAIVPSKNEGFSLVSAEAQVMHTYCFASLAVPEECNIGAMMRIDIRNGSKWWAKKIVQSLKCKQKMEIDVGSISMESYISVIRKFYEI